MGIIKTQIGRQLTCGHNQNTGRKAILMDITKTQAGRKAIHMDITKNTSRHAGKNAGNSHGHNQNHR